MTISSRTPEGIPNRCPLCGAEVCIEPSQPAGDAPCPRCGHLLWFLSDRFGVSSDRLNRSTSFIEAIGADSLDVVELVMELEEEFGVTVPDDQAEKIKTVGDAIDAIAAWERLNPNA
jgi:acyl carrier protein